MRMFEGLKLNQRAGFFLLTVCLFSSAGVSYADIQTSLSFASPSSISAGGNVTVDVGVSFFPTAGFAISTQFIDVATGTPVSSCATDLSTCEQLQTLSASSTLQSVAAELIAPNGSGGLDTYPIDTIGTTTIVLSYPNAGTWDITTSGSDQEQVAQQQCVTLFVGGVATGAASCNTTQSSTIAGTFNPNGTPRLSVTVGSASTTVPEPASLSLLAAGLATACLFLARQCRASSRRARA